MINRPKKFAKNNDIWNIKTKFSKNKGILSKYTPIKLVDILKIKLFLLFSQLYSPISSLIALIGFD